VANSRLMMAAKMIAVDMMAVDGCGGVVLGRITATSTRSEQFVEQQRPLKLKRRLLDIGIS
jgi:hypothetical protein